MSGNNGDEKADSQKVLELIHLKLVAAFMDEEAKATAKPLLALRKAILLLIALCANNADEPTREVIDFLLTNWGPLGGEFHEHTHEFLKGARIARAREQDGRHINVFLTQSLMDKLLSDVE